MGHAFYVSSAGAMARMRQLDVVANNLANADTIGFKRDRTLFESALEDRLVGPDGRLIGGAEALAFVRAQSIDTELAGGPVRATGNPLDVAIEGDGFFEVLTDAGLRYTRAGSFLVNPDGLLATPEGHLVMGDGGPIAAGLGRPQILAGGEVVDELRQRIDGQIDVLGRLRVVELPEGFSKEGANLFRIDEGAPTPVVGARLAERSLEGSNVQPVRALASMIEIQRSFDASLRVLRASDEITQELIQEVSS